MWDSLGATAAFLLASGIALVASVVSWIWIYPEIRVKRV
jgi:hypothetical protein